MTPYRVVYRKPQRVKERTTLLFARNIRAAMQEAIRRFPTAIIGTRPSRQAEQAAERNPGRSS